MSAYEQDGGQPTRAFRFGVSSEAELQPPSAPFAPGDGASSWPADGADESRRFGPAPFALEPEPAPDDDLPPAAESAELPFVDLRAFPVDRSAARLIPAEVARFYSALPYGFEAGIPLVALADESVTAMLSLRLAMGQEARFKRASRLELASAIAAAYAEPGHPEVPAAAEHALPVQSGTGTRFRVVVRLHDTEPVDADAFDSVVAAKARAVEIAEQLASDDGAWPFVHGRFLRPDAVVSVDIVEERAH